MILILKMVKGGIRQSVEILFEPNNEIERKILKIWALKGMLPEQ